MLGGKCRIGQRGLLHSFDEANQGGAKPDPGILTRRDVRFLPKPMRKKTSPSPISRLPSRFLNGPSRSP